jgi:hypothetical protein
MMILKLSDLEKEEVKKEKVEIIKKVEKNIKNIFDLKKVDKKEKQKIEKEESFILDKKEDDTEKQKTKADVEKLTKIRINNTLALANKKTKERVLKKWEMLAKYTLDPKYGGVAVLLMDAVVQVASEEYMIITYSYENSTRRANFSLVKAEELLKKIIGKPYKFIAITYETWAKIKDEYVTRIRRGEKYEIIEEEKGMAENINDKNDENNKSESLKASKNLFDIISIILTTTETTMTKQNNSDKQKTAIQNKDTHIKLTT